MNDASESSFVTCVKLVENHAPKLMVNRGALTAHDKAVLLADKSIRSIAVSLTSSQVTTTVKGKCDGAPGFSHPDNVAAFKAIMALGDKIVRGDITNIARAHGAHVGTVQKMVHNAKGRPPRVKKEKQA